MFKITFFVGKALTLYEMGFLYYHRGPFTIESVPLSFAPLYALFQGARNYTPIEARRQYLFFL